MSLNIVSFGFTVRPAAGGRPSCSTCAACPNPFYVPELKELTGLEPAGRRLRHAERRLAGAACAVREHARILRCRSMSRRAKASLSWRWAARAASTARSPLPASSGEFCEGLELPARRHAPRRQAHDVKAVCDLQRGQQPRTAAPNASISPFGIPFDKILTANRALGAKLLAHNLPQNFPVGVAVVGACLRRRPTDLNFYHSLTGGTRLYST